MKILEFLLAAIRAFIVILGMTTMVFIYGLSCIFRPHSPKRAFVLRRRFVKLALFCLNIKVELIGSVPNTTPVIYISNHRSFADPLVIGSFVDGFGIAKAEVGQMPFISKGLEVTGIIYVKREDKSSRTATRKAIIDTVKSNENIIIFAEGTVNKQKEMLPLKYGTFIAAAENNIKIIPIALEFQSKRDLWTVPSFLGQHVQQFGKWKTNVRISFGDPIQEKDGQLFHDLTENWMKNKVEELQDGWSTAFN